MSIELNVWVKERHDLLHGGEAVSIPLRRVTAIIQIGDNAPVDGLIDTGAYLSVFTQLAWSGFSEEIEWLTSGDEPGLPDWLKSVHGLTGRSVPCRLGRIPMVIFDLAMKQCSPEFSVLGMMLTDDCRLPRRSIIGLNGHPLELGFHLSAGPHPQAWIDSPLEPESFELFSPSPL